MSEFNLEQYLSDGVRNILKEAVTTVFTNTKESAFIANFAIAAKKSEAIRKKYEKLGKHIPPFLICSITSKCNLHCAGCYARQNHSCHDGNEKNQMTADEWSDIFSQASELGISFILLAGGEPLVRYDVLERASLCKSIVFPVFTNGTMINEKYIDLFDKNRNLIPMISIEGNEKKTDDRRGIGVYDKLTSGMKMLYDKKLFFGASITVTTQNITEVTSDKFIDELTAKGCKLIIYVEYVPVDESTEFLAPDEKERTYLKNRIDILRKSSNKIMYISFPGDEKSSGGCLAAGRGFFHINSTGGAEPCPFSPYSDTDIRNITLLKALDSPLFLKLRSSSCLDDNHTGGCVLFEKRSEVESMLKF